MILIVKQSVDYYLHRGGYVFASICLFVSKKKPLKAVKSLQYVGILIVSRWFFLGENWSISYLTKKFPKVNMGDPIYEM